MRLITPDDLPLSVLEAGYKLGKLVSASRKSRGLSQQSLCELAGLARTTLVEIEKGSPRVQFAYWLLVLEALELLPILDTALSAKQMGLLAAAVPRPRRSKSGK